MDSVLVGDGFCNDETNTIHCGFDGGDCCYSFVVEKYCRDCQCLTGNTGEETNPLIGNGVCNDETNNIECNYDGGDCCMSDVNSDICFDCFCYFNGIITSPKYPKNYEKYLDLTWLIQLPLGQFIKIDFTSFDIHHFYNPW